MYKVSAFAHDILLYVKNLKQKLPNILEVLNRYGEIHNLNINVGKSEILNISVHQAECKVLSPMFPFEGRHGGLKYLGRFITASSTKIISTELYSSSLKKKQDLKKLSDS